jgi:hypothetical protein
MIVISDDLFLSTPVGVDLNAPVVGWRNSLTAANVSSEAALVGFPVTNLANPSTYLRWKSGSLSMQHVKVEFGAPTPINYLAVAGHNLGTGRIASAVEGALTIDSGQRVLLHFNGVDASTVFTDSASGKTSTGAAPNAWTAAGNAQIDTADFQFSGSSGLFDGTGDWITTPDSADFEPLSSDFTIDFWCKVLDNGVQRGLCGKATGFTGATDRSYFMYRDTTTNHVIAEVSNGATTVAIGSATAITVAAGWKHVALVRSGNSLLLFVGGVLENTAAFTGTVNDVASPFAVATIGAGLLAGWNGWIDEFRLSIGIARWTATFTPPNAPYISDGFTKALLHFTGPDASTSFVDSATRTWTPGGNAQVDTSQSKFGGASGQFDGVGDFVTVPAHVDFVLGSGDFTIDCWFRVAPAGTNQLILAGQLDSTATAAGSAWFIERQVTTAVMRFFVSNGSSFFIVTGTSQYTDVINPGWHHLAAVRIGNVLRMFIDGVQQGGDVAFTGSVQSPVSSLSVGRGGEVAGSEWNGWIDEFRMIVGRAAWTANFKPEDVEYDQWNWTLIGDEQMPADDSPIIWRFAQQSLLAVRLRVKPIAVAPEASVMYTDVLLQLQRRIYVGHRVLNYNRRANVVTGFSDEANFLGRLVLGELKESSLSLQNITPAFYRSDVDPWLSNSIEKPFFFAWRPQGYPLEVGFCWLTGDAQMSNQRPNGMVQVSASLRGAT